MSDLVPINAAGLLQSRVERQTSRSLEVIRARQVVAAAQEVAKVEVIAETTQAALLAASQVSVLEDALAARSVKNAERLRHIADAGALGMTEVVLNAGRRRW
jgi:hypothetical protein